MGILDLIDWTIETARELRTPNDLTAVAPAIRSEAILKSDGRRPIIGLDTEIIADQPTPDQRAPEQAAPERPVDERAVPHQPAAEQTVAEKPAGHASDGPSVIRSEAATLEPMVPAPTADIDVALLRAIVDPGIHTSKADRYRAIDLRWILRDIAADRLRAPALSELDLQVLIDLKLVELRGGVPYLTNAGVTAII